LGCRGVSPVDCEVREVGTKLIQMPQWLRCRNVTIVAVIFVAYTLITFGVYLTRTLHGDINNHILAAEMWGVPKEAAKNGVVPLYRGASATGWDGQFYYYIANDLLAKKDASDHIDAPAYRYQRIGLSLYTAIVSKLLGRDWVSPSSYLISYFVLVLVATVVGAEVLRQRKISPYWILIWALSAGTQITLFNALPDAAADAFLIISIYLVLKGRLAFSAIAFTFSALSREIYVLFPVAIWAINVNFSLLNARHLNLNWRCIYQANKYHWLLVPVAVFIFWQIYLTHHFGMAPASQAAGILGVPYVAWWDYFLSGIKGHHKLLGTGFVAYAEALSLLMFLCVNTLAIILSAFKLCEFFKVRDIVMTGLAAVTFMLAAVYTCFGPTVMMHYTGYTKAMSVLLLLIILMDKTTSGFERLTRKLGLVIISIAVFLTSVYNLKARIIPDANDFDKYTRMSLVTSDSTIPCHKEYQVNMKVSKVTLLRGGLLYNLLGSKDKLLVEVQLTNLGGEPLISTRKIGSVHMSGQWLNSSDEVVKDGIRSAIPTAVMPGQSTSVTVVAIIPKQKETLYLQLSPVQEGCAWFYRAMPSLSADARIEIR